MTKHLRGILILLLILVGLKVHSAEIFISEYVEGSSNNKALELYNPTLENINLDDIFNDYQIEFYSNGSSSAGTTIDLTGTINAGNMYILTHTSATFMVANGGSLNPHQTFSGIWFNGNDAVVLKKGSTIIDVIGKIGEDPSTEWGSGDTSTQNNTLRRKADINTGDPNGNDDFDPALEWEGFALDTFDDLGLHQFNGPNITKIHAIQGNDPASSMLGDTVTIEAIVVGDFQGSQGLSGFFVQEEDVDVDSDVTTSEGILIYDGSSPSVDVNVGDKVSIEGQITEYKNITEIKNPIITIRSSGNPLPTASVIHDLVAANTASLERYEGMRVQLSQTLSVIDSYWLDKYGQLVLAVEGPQIAFTQQNAPSVTGYSTYQTQIANHRILLDDGSSRKPTTFIFGRGNQALTASNPLRNGDTVTGLTGILDYRYDAYRIQTNTRVNFIAANARPTTPPYVGGTLKIASFNLLNYFTTMGSRGADNNAEFMRQQQKLVAALSVMSADIVGLMEIENNGYGANSAIQRLVNALNAKMGAGTYAFVRPDLATLGSGDITTALIYKPATVMLSGAAVTKNDGAFWQNNRPPLVQTFTEIASEAKFTLAVNHFKARSSGTGLLQDQDQSDGQGKSNYTRTQAAQELTAWLATDPTECGAPDVLIIGDLNAYTQEAPLLAMKNAGYTDLLATSQGTNAYSYVFDGQNGYLDHALANKSLTPQVTGAALWHINADEPRIFDYNDDNPAGLYTNSPFRSSDHDPVLIGLNFSNNHTFQTTKTVPLPLTSRLFVEVKGEGTVKTYPGDINCNPSHCQPTGDKGDFTGIICDPDYCATTEKTSTHINIVPMPDAYFEFVRWGGHKDCRDGKIWLIGNRLCVAHFRELPKRSTTTASCEQSTASKSLKAIATTENPQLEGKIAPLLLQSVSARGTLLGGERDVMMGFTLSAPKTPKVLLRGIGLEDSVDPTLRLQKTFTGEELGMNDNWNDNPQIVPIPNQYRANLQKKDAALLLDLPAGDYTVILSSKGKKGVGLININQIK
jgi:hypothetical protein